MGFESRLQGGVSAREEFVESLARAHRLELERAKELLKRAELAAAEDLEARPVRWWFTFLVEEEGRRAAGRRAAHESTAEARRGRWEGDRALHVRGAGVMPGRQTLVMREAERDASSEPVARGERESGASAREAREAPRPETGHLDVVTQWRMSQAFGFDFSGVSIRRDSPLATGATRALVKDGEIHFREGAYQPGTRAGDWLIAHELAHLVQQQGSQQERGGRAASRKAIEREADRAATLALLGHTPPIALRAQPAVAYAFSDGEEHEDALDAVDTTDDAVGEGGDSGVEDAERAGSEEAPDASVASAGEEPAEAGEAQPEAAGQSGAAQPGEASDGTAEPAAPEAKAAESGAAADAKAADAKAAEAKTFEESTADAKAAHGDAEPTGDSAVDSAAEPMPDTDEETPAASEDADAGAEEGGDAGGAPRVGSVGGAPAKPEKEAPEISTSKPEAGLSKLVGVRPDKLVAVLGQVHTAAATDVGKARAEQRANPPKQLSTGAAAAASSKRSADGACGDAGTAAGAAGAPGAKGAPGPEHADRAFQTKVPGGEAAKQAQHGEAAKQQKSAGHAVTEVAQSISTWFSSWFGGTAGKSGGDKTQGAMNESETRQMSGSLDKLPTNASSIATEPGPAPALAMKGEARSTSGAERAQLETKAVQLETQGRAESRVPMGEDAIETSVPTQELAASLPAGGEALEAALPTVEGMATSEEVGIVAKEQHGAEIDAALAKAGTDVTAERAKHTQEEAKARAEADKQLKDLKTKADADQAKAKAKAKAETERARGEWQAEIDKKGADARRQADRKVAEGMAQVVAEEAKANEEAKRHIDEGKQKAEEEKQKGEKEAADAKQKGKSKSSGFFGWLSSKAKAFFAGIKKAISAAIDAARRAVKAVIDAAKKLAMAAIELARKAITAVIKAIGDALLAISEVLLAAFPGLKAKFQGLIKRAVQAATDAVNKLAEGLKKAVQAALDSLGKALDAALGLLEKGLHAIVDAVGSVVQGFIDAARAVVEMLGTWAKLIKDVAMGPGAWLGKLGSAVIDGIKNHLWAAFKTAVVEWFKSKVFELLGVAGMVLQLLLEGGITQDDIVKMALDSLITAIPMALVAILIEKLVSMIVPAAGALMAIIEGLQAAWGTVSRIIAAFDAFMAFLLAVQSGAAGPLFATALASAAIVVLDFVSNWLLKKLRGPAGRVGARLRGMAEKFSRRSPGRRRRTGKSRSRSRAEDRDRPHAETSAKGQNRHKDKRKETPAQKQARLERAVAEVKALMTKRQRLSLLLRARLALLRRKYKLDKLEAKQKGSTNAWEVHAKVNPEARFDLFSIEDDAADLRRAVGGQLKALPKTATIQEVKALCARAASSHMAAGYKLDWQYMRDSWVLFLERPGHKIPRTCVGEFRKTTNYKQIATDGDQTLFQDEDKREFVHDSLGQYVPRLLIRNISAEDAKALKKKQGITATDPKARVNIWQHVTGTKPSPYISTTKLEGNELTNPQGGNLGGEHGTVRVDLLKISPKKLYDLTTRKGQDTWNLSNPKTDIKRQALEDVVRTQEVLIKGEIPPDAITRLS